MLMADFVGALYGLLNNIENVMLAMGQFKIVLLI